MCTPAGSNTVYDLDTLGNEGNCILPSPPSTHTLTHVLPLRLTPCMLGVTRALSIFFQVPKYKGHHGACQSACPLLCTTWQDTGSPCTTRRELCWFTRSRGRPRASGPSYHMVPSQTNNDQFPWHIFIDLDRQSSTFHSILYLTLITVSVQSFDTHTRKLECLPANISKHKTFQLIELFKHKDTGV